MPPKAKTEPEPLGPPPTSTADLCACPPFDLDPSTTAHGCEHGSWTFAPADVDPGPSLEEAVAHALDELTAEQLQALLDAKTAK